MILTGVLFAGGALALAGGWLKGTARECDDMDAWRHRRRYRLTAAGGTYLPAVGAALMAIAFGIALDGLTGALGGGAFGAVIGFWVTSLGFVARGMATAHQPV